MNEYRYFLCTNIVADVSNEEEDYEGYPVYEDYENYPFSYFHGNVKVRIEAEPKFESEDVLESEICDELSNSIGFCIQSFEYEEISKAEFESSTKYIQ